MLVPGFVLSAVHDFAFLLFICYEMPVRPFLQPVQFPCNDSMTLWDVSHFYQFCFVGMLLLVLSTPSSTSLMKMLDRTGIDSSGIPLLTGLQLGHLSLAAPCHWTRFQSTLLSAHSAHSSLDSLWGSCRKLCLRTYWSLGRQNIHCFPLVSVASYFMIEKLFLTD